MTWLTRVYLGSGTGETTESYYTSTCGLREPKLALYRTTLIRYRWILTAPCHRVCPAVPADWTSTRTGKTFRNIPHHRRDRGSARGCRIQPHSTENGRSWDSARETKTSLSNVLPGDERSARSRARMTWSVTETIREQAGLSAGRGGMGGGLASETESFCVSEMLWLIRREIPTCRIRCFA